VASFAFGRRVAVLDTNVGRVLARAIANRSLSARQARDLAKELLGRAPSAPFNQALLDLGSQFCRSKPLCASCPVARACTWNRDGGVDPAVRSGAVSRPQSRFPGSNRQLRGDMLRQLRDGPRTKSKLLDRFSQDEVGESVLEGLVQDGLVTRRGRVVSLVGD
jgi:A/G-specific adenine glycosylase